MYQRGTEKTLTAQKGRNGDVNLWKRCLVSLRERASQR